MAVNREQFEASLEALCRQHGLGHVIALTRDGCGLLMVAVAPGEASPADHAVVNVVTEVLHEFLQENREEISDKIQEFMDNQ